MNNIKTKEGTISKLINFDNIINLNSFIIKLVTKFKNSTQYTSDNSDFKFVGNICICNIEKHSVPNWNSTSYYKIKMSKKNTTQYRIILYKYDNLTIYIEKNGQFKLLDNILDDNKYNIMKIKFISKNINTPDKLHNEINNFLLNKDIIKEINNIYLEYNNSLHPLINDNDSEYTLDRFTSLYNDLVSNKQLSNDKKLDSYNCNDCIENNRSSETKYNKLICEKYPDKYIKLDIKLIDRCEIADIFDKQNNLLFHNKKNKDLRLLSCQVFIGALMLKSSKKSIECSNFINKYGIDINNFKYVFGIIKEKETSSLPHRIAIGNACYILNKLNIEYFVDFIEYIK
jgi:hypothetical protein